MQIVICSSWWCILLYLLSIHTHMLTKKFFRNSVMNTGKPIPKPSTATRITLMRKWKVAWH